MKKLLLLLPLAALAATNEYDMIKGVDLTALTNVTVSQLNQLVDRARTATNKGMTITSNAAPDVANNARYTNFIWIDTSFQPPRLRVYTTSSNVWNEPGFTNISVADDSITSAKIVNGTILGIDIAAGTLTSDKLATGIITSNYIAAGQITSDKFAANSVLSATIGPSAINSATLIAGSVINVTNLATNQINGLYITNFGIYSNNYQTSSVYGPTIATNTIGESNIVANTLTTNSMTTNVTALMAKGWSIWDSAAGSTTVAGNITTVTKVNTGWYSNRFATAMPNTSYAVFFTPTTGAAFAFSGAVSNKTTEGFAIYTVITTTGSANDVGGQVMVFGK